jgi:acyl-CoA synthetase (NDP forming)
MVVASPPPRVSLPDAAAGIDLRRVQEVVARARRDGRRQLLEPEGRHVLGALGIAVPRAAFVPLGRPVGEADLAELRTERVVLKVVAEGLVHKTERGGVAVVDRRARVVQDAIEEMRGRLVDVELAGFLVVEHVAHELTLGGELLAAVHWTHDLGPIVAIGAGGIHAEGLAADLRDDRRLAVLSPDLTPPERIDEVLAGTTAVRFATRPQRGRSPLVEPAVVSELAARLLAFAERFVPDEVRELEVNPLATTPEGLVALDVLVTLGEPPSETPVAPPPRPVRKLERLLAPRSIAIAGVSSGENPGRTILRNVLRDGFAPGAVTVVKPGAETIDGCRCVPTIDALPGKVDLFVVALAARPAAALVAEIVERDAAETLIVIPGGLEEKTGGEALAAGMRDALAAARRRPDGGPLINGGNCLGVRSRPGRYDTLFIPESRLAGPGGRPAPLAILAQSGAFAISRLSRLEGLDPKYVVSVGNQLDLTLGDYLEYAADDPEIAVVGAYLEGFAPLDGLRFLVAARRVADRGGVVVLYRGGRTRAGATASSSHTAAIAGDAALGDALARQVGVVVAETLDDFDDLVGTFTRLAGRTVGGRRLAALSNSGFECVAIADNLDRLELASFDGATAARLTATLGAAHATEVVDVHNPVDLTPMADDAAFGEAAAAILASDAVDVAVIGDVPFTPALRTIPLDDDGASLLDPRTVGGRLVELWRTTTKAWVTVVDAGPRYDPLARALEAAGIPTFRTVDRAVRALGEVVAARLTTAAQSASRPTDR